LWTANKAPTAISIALPGGACKPVLPQTFAPCLTYGHTQCTLKSVIRSFRIRINDQWRICFFWRDGDAFDVEIVDYH